MVRRRRFRRIVAFLIISLAVLYGTAVFRFFSGRAAADGIFIGVPVAKADEFASFLESRNVGFRSAGKLELQLDHYNPERLTVNDLRSRFLPGDDRMTPFLEALPELYDIERNGQKFRLFFPDCQPETDFFNEWEKKYPDAELFSANKAENSAAFLIYFYIIGSVCFVLTLIIQWRARKALLYIAAVFPAVMLSSSTAVLWAAIFIVNMFLSLWRKWAPHREYRMATGINIVSRRDEVRIALQATAAVLCAVLPSVLIPGERVGIVTGVAIAAAGLLWGAAAFELGTSGQKQIRLVFKPMMGETFRKPLKTAVPELVLGVCLLAVPVGFTVFSLLPANDGIIRESDFFLPSDSYTAVYKQALRQLRGKLNAVGYLEEKVFQYCYRYRKIYRLPEPDTEVFITEYYYKNSEIHSEKIIAEIFTERGFNSIIKKSENDPLSACFLSVPETDGFRFSVGFCLLWIFFSAFYFVLLMPFFRMPAGKLRQIKGKV